MKILIVISILLIGGCSFTLRSFDLNKAEEYCSDKHGIYEIGGIGVFDNYVICNNSSRSRLDRL